MEYSKILWLGASEKLLPTVSRRYIDIFPNALI
jgi:hypothetical protein